MAQPLRDLGAAAARVVLPKSLEERFGIPGPTAAQPDVTDQRRATFKAIQEDINADPSAYENTIKGIIIQELKSGNTDSEKIKNAVRRNIKKEINEKILTKLHPRPPATFGGFISNLRGDVRETVEGIGLLLGMPIEAAYQAVTNPVESYQTVTSNAKSAITSPAYREQVYKNWIDPTVQEVLEYRHPRTKAYEDPLDVFLDVTGLSLLAGLGMQRIGRATKKTTASKVPPSVLQEARDILRNSRDTTERRRAADVIKANNQAKQSGVKVRPQQTAVGRRIENFGKALEIAGTPLAPRTISKTTAALVRNFVPNGDTMLRNLEKAASVSKQMNQNQIQFMTLRNRAINEINTKVNALSKDEAAILPRVLEGFEAPPVNASNAFNEVVGLFRSISKDGARLGMKAGKFTPDILERRRFQPLANFLEKEQGVDFTPATRGSRARFQTVMRETAQSLKRAETRFNEGKITKSQFNKIKTEINKRQRGARRQFDKDLIDKGFSSLTGAELRAQLGLIKQHFPQADPVYMRHFLADAPEQFGNFFINTKPVRTYNPKSTKKSYNRSGYIGQDTNVTKQQLKDVLRRSTMEIMKWEQNMALVESITRRPDVRLLRPGEELEPGYKAFMPDGLLTFYRGNIDLVKEMNKIVEAGGAGPDVYDVLYRGIREVFPDENAVKNYVGVKRGKVYQVPEAVFNVIEKRIKETNPYFKIFYDQPLDAFRFAALSLYPRWHVNNMVGNAIFSIVSGDAFNPQAFYAYQQARKHDRLMPDDLFGGVHMVERTTSGHLGGAVDRIPWVKSTVQLHDKFLDSGTVGTVVKNIESSTGKAFKPLIAVGNYSFRINQDVDDMFKGAAYINRALKEERKGLLRRMTTSFEETQRILEDLNQNPKKRQKIIDEVHNYYYYGLNLTDVERRIIRRAIPFYSWMRWSTLYAYRITTETPVRANIIANMAQQFYDMTGQDELPGYLRGSVPIGTDEDGTVYYLRTSGMNPFYGLVDAFQRGPLGAAGVSSSPAIKTGIERMTGRDIFLGNPFTKEGLQRAFNGDLYRFDPELGETVKVESPELPGRIEHLLRNFLPQYLLLESALTGFNRRYTAEGLDTILADLFRDPEERKAIIKDVITQEPIEGSSAPREVGKALGVNVTPITLEQRKARREALERATAQQLNASLPIMNERFKEQLKARIMQEVVKGTPEAEIKTRVRQWILNNWETIQQMKK